ncbi:MAG: SH3 domain-containing protein [Beijerinckiaceae bacterium]|nr:SH3 domain-containing protein [Beijerinckiaceae bacterium]
MRLALTIAALLAMPALAQATAFCPVRQTADGFVALRAAPDAEARVLRRIPAGEDVQIDTTRRARVGWQPVIYWGPARQQKLSGWVRARLLEQECG